MGKYRKKPVVIEAVEWRGNNEREMITFVDDAHSYGPDSAFLKSMFIPTLEGEMEATPGDWIIKGIAGEFYPCKPDIFAATYEPVDLDDLPYLADVKAQAAKDGLTVVVDPDETAT